MINTDWQSLGDVQYRKWVVYDEMAWGDFDLDSCIICGAPYGGPLAVVRDEKKLVEAEKDLTPTLRIFSSSGRLLAEIPWEHKGLVGLGWSDQEALIAVFSDGGALVHDLHGRLLSSFNLLQDLAGLDLVALVEARFWGDGVAALGDDQQVYAAAGVHARFPRLYSVATGLTREAPATALAVLAPRHTASGGAEVLLGTAGGSLVVADELGAEDQRLEGRLPAPIAAMAPAPNGRFLACFTRGGVLTVLSTSFTTKVLDFDTSTPSPPAALLWCGEDCVAAHWRGLGLLLVGPFGDWVRFPLAEAAVLVPEADCCRAVTARRCELVQRVPAATEAIVRIGSTSPAALLHDAAEAFQEGDPRADEGVRALLEGRGPGGGGGGGNGGGGGGGEEGGGGGGEEGGGGEGGGCQLAGAVAACLAAAAAEWEPAAQKKLLRAAAYGKGFLGAARGGDAAGAFAAACRRLRVLNAVRRPGVGLPLTAQQYDRLGPEALADRLLARGEHLLALRCCEYLRLPLDGVLAAWACEEVARAAAQGVDDEEALARVGGRLALARPQAAAYARAAAAADRAGRRRLATLLLDREPRAADRVPLLLGMGEGELALRKAVEADDVDLVHLALLHLEQSGDPQFPARAFAFPKATNLLKAYYRHKRPPAAAATEGAGAGGEGAEGEAAAAALAADPLSQLLLARARAAAAAGQGAACRAALAEAGARAAALAYEQPRWAARLAYLREAARVFGKAKELAFQRQATEEQVELLEAQRELGRRTGLALFADLSVTDTLYTLITLAAGDGAPLPSSEGAGGAAVDFHAEAARLQARFRVSKERFYHVKIKALAASGQWAALGRFAAERRPPVGYAPFARAALAHGRPLGEVEAFAARVPDAEERYELYAAARAWEKAAECALKLRDRRRLFDLRALAPDPETKQRLNEMANRLK